MRECDSNKIPGQCEGTWNHSLAASPRGGGLCAGQPLRDTVGKGRHSTAPQFQNLGKWEHFAQAVVTFACFGVTVHFPQDARSVVLRSHCTD